jgi:hypothetical protein
MLLFPILQRGIPEGKSPQTTPVRGLLKVILTYFTVQTCYQSFPKHQWPVLVHFKGQNCPIFSHFLTQNRARRAPNPSVKGYFGIFFTVQICFKETLTFTDPEFSFFCYNLALRILHFSRLFSLNSATRQHFFQISSPFDYKNSPQKIGSIVVCRRVKTDTQTHPCFKIKIQSHICTLIQSCFIWALTLANFSL